MNAVLPRKVMILGRIFDFEEKAPFLPSGLSIYAAVEYDFARDRLRCHECGEWFASVSAHIGHGAHGITVSEYKQRHGLRGITSLNNISMREAHSAAAFRNNQGAIAQRALKAKGYRKPKEKKLPANEERRNDRNKCFAQTVFKIQVLAKKLGRTPTLEDLRRNGIGKETLKRAARSLGATSHNEAMEMAGFVVNQKGHLADADYSWL